MPIRDMPPLDPGDQRDGAPPGQHGESFDARDWLTHATGELRESFARNRRVISFTEYVTLFSAEPVRQLRSAAQYLRDVFDHFGSEPVRTPRGPMIRWKLFDCPVGQRQGRAGRPGRGSGGGVPAGLELRARGAHQPPHPAARPERQRQVDVRRLHAAGDGALLDAGRRRPLQVQLDLPVAEADQGRHRVRRRHRVGRRSGDLRVPRRRADRIEDLGRDARPPAAAVAARAPA